MLKTVLKGLCLSGCIGVFTGCSNSSDDNGSNPSSPPSSSGSTLSAPVTVSGTAAKGIVSNGVVNAYAVVNGIKASQSTVTTTTNAAGQYSLVFGAGDPDTPYIIEIEAGENTTIKCDIPTGCDDGAVYGETFAVTDNDFMLSSFVADASVEDAQGNVIATQTANANVFTHIATQIIEDELGSAQTDEDVRERIQQVQSSVVSRFSFTGDLTQLPVIDITDSVAVNSANETTLKFSAMNSAIVSAAIASNGSGMTITDAIASFTAQFTDVGIADISSSSTTTTSVSFVDVLNNTGAVISAIANVNGVTSSVISSVTIAINNEVTFTTITGTDTPTKGNPSPTAGDTDVAQAKALVQDLRSLSQGSFFDEADEMRFDSLASNAEMVEQIDADNIVDAAELMLDGATAASRAYSELDGAPTPVDMPFITMVDALEYSVTAVDGADESLILTVVQADSMLNMVATLADVTELSQQSDLPMGGFSESFEAMGSMMLSGSVTVGQSKVTVQDVSITASGEELETFSSSQADPDVTGQVDLDLSGTFTIEQLDDAGMVDLSLTGDAVLTLNNIIYSDSAPDSTTAVTSEVSSDSIGFDSVTFSLGGGISDSSGAEFDVVLALSLGEFATTVECGAGTDCQDAETASNFVPATLSLAFEGSIADASVAEVVTTLTRVSEEEASVNVTLNYDGKSITVASQTDREGLTIMNQDAITAKLDETEEGLAEGTIKKGEKLLASIVTTSNDLVIVRYIDGVVESL